MTVLNEVVLNQVLVRFDGPDERTRALLDAVRRDGTCFMSGTTWRGRYHADLGVELVHRRGRRRRERPGHPEDRRTAALVGSVVAPPVRFENVQAEVVRGVAPDGVCVVGAALGVVPLDEQARSLHAVSAAHRARSARPRRNAGRRSAAPLYAVIGETASGTRPKYVGRTLSTSQLLLGPEFGTGNPLGPRGVLGARWSASS